MSLNHCCQFFHHSFSYLFLSLFCLPLRISYIDFPSYHQLVKLLHQQRPKQTRPHRNLARIEPRIDQLNLAHAKHCVFGSEGLAMTAVAVVHQTAEILFYSFWVLEVFEMVEDVHLVYLLFLQKHEPVLVLGVTAAQSALLETVNSKLTAVQNF